MRSGPEDAQGLTICVGRPGWCWAPLLHATCTHSKDRDGLAQLPSSNGTRGLSALTNTSETC